MPLRNFNDGQEVVLEDFNAATQAILKDVYDRGFYELLLRTENAFFGDSLHVIFSNATNLICKKGLGFQTDALAVSPNVKRKPLVLPNDKAIAITPPHGSLDRIDIVCVKATIVDELSEQRNYKDAADSSISLQTFVVQKDWLAEVLVVDGVPDAAPVEPDVPAGYLKISSFLVSSVTGIANADAVIDERNLFPIGQATLLNTLGAEMITGSAAAKLIDVIKEIDSFLKVHDLAVSKSFSVVAVNNSARTDIPGLILNKAVIKSSVFEYDIYRKTDTPTELCAVGRAVAYHKGVVDQWTMVDGSEGDDAGFELGIDQATGQVFFKTSNMAGANYVGELRLLVRYIYKAA